MTLGKESALKTRDALEGETSLAFQIYKGVSLFSLVYTTKPQFPGIVSNDRYEHYLWTNTV